MRRKNKPRSRKCVCLRSSNCAIVDFPVLWSELRTNQQLCDGTVRCARNKVFPIHRIILSAVSPYFKAVFTNSLRECNTESLSEVSLGSVSGDIFTKILDYAYTGSCRVTAENVQQLLPLADQLEVLGVVQLCCQFLIKELKPHNCLGIFKFARHYFCKNLEDRGRKYILHNFKEILLESSEFKDLECDELEAILRDDELNVRNEEVVFESIRRWVEAKPIERKNYVPRLLECVRFGLVSHKYLTSNVITWNFIDESEECQRLVYPASAYLTGEEPRYRGNDIDMKNHLSRPRVPYEILFTIGGWTAGAPTSFIETYDTRANRWFVLSNTDSTPRSYHGVCTIDNLIYIIGGLNGHTHLNSVRSFDPVTKEWQERACMYHARCYVSVCTHAGKIYAIGGFNGRTRMSSGERYDPQRNQWEMIPPMHKPRSDAGAAALNEKIYIVGGFNGFHVFRSAEVLDVKTNQWSYIRSMLNPRSGVSLVAFKNCLYALGGDSGRKRLASGERYNPYRDDWREISEMFCPRSNLATGVLDDMIFALGGYRTVQLGTNNVISSPISYVECYNPESNQWYDASPMNINRSALGACVIAGLVNAREYSYVGKTQIRDNNV